MEQQQTITASGPRHYGSIDAVKGIAIILMVYAHAAQGGMHRHLWDSMPSWRAGIPFIDAFIYSFHMAAFFFVAGLFIAGSVKRRGGPGFALEKIKTILYPYILWCSISAAFLPVTSRFMAVHKPFNWRELLMGVATGNFSWFLATLFVCQILTLLLLRLPHWLQMAIVLIASMLVPDTGIVVLSQPFFYLPFVVAGMWVSADRLASLDRIPNRWAWGGFAVLLGLQLALIRILGPVTRWDQLPLGLTGIAMLVLLCHAIRGTITDKWLQWYGAGSLAVFILSGFVNGATREVLIRVFHTTHPVPYLLINTVMAATIPALIWAWQDKLRIGWLFRWPAGKKRSIPSRPETVAG